MIEQISNNGLFRATFRDLGGGFSRAFDPAKLKDNEFLNYANLIAYKIGYVGNASKRNGFAFYDTGDIWETSGAVIQNIFEYTKRGTSPVLIVKSTGNLESKAYADGGYHADYTTIDSSDTATKCAFLQIKDKLIQYNRNDGTNLLTSRKWQSGGSLLNYGNLPCPNTFSLADLADDSSDMEGGLYKYLVTFLYDSGEESYPLVETNVHPDNLVEMKLKFKEFACTAVKPHITITWEDGGYPQQYLSMTALGYGSIYSHFDILLDIANSNTNHIVTDLPSKVTTIYLQGGMVTNIQEMLDLINEDTVLKDLFVATSITDPTRGIDIYPTPGIVGGFTSGAKGVTLSSIPTGGTDVVARKIYRTINGGNEFYWLTTIHDNTTTTYNDLIGSTNLVEPLNISHGFKPYKFKNACVHKDRLIIGNCETDYCTDIPVTTGISFSVRAGANNYNYKFAYIDIASTLNGNSDGKPYTGIRGKLTSAKACSDRLTINSTNVNTISGMVQGDGFCGRIAIFRTAAGGSTYYFLGMTALGATTFTDNITDANLILQPNILIDNGIESLETEKQYPSLVRVSNVNSPGTFSTDEFMIEDNDNGEIRGMKSARDGVIIWKNTDVYKIFSYGLPSTWVYEKIINSIGCDDDNLWINSILEIPMAENNEYIWKYNNKIYHWRGGGLPVNISERIQDLLDANAFSNLDVCYHEKYNWVIFSYLIGGGTGGATAIDGGMFIYDLNSNVWHGFSNLTAVSNAEWDLRAVTYLRDGSLICGNTDKKLYLYKTTVYADYLRDNALNSYVSKAITTNLTTKAIDTTYIDLERVLAKLYSSATSGTISVYVIEDNSTHTLIGSVTIDANLVRINLTGNIQNKKQVLLEFVESNSQFISYQELAFDFKKRSEELGW